MPKPVVELDVAWDDQGLAPAVVQDDRTGEVLMVGWMNANALQKTQTSGLVHFWSRSRQTLWQKGETSGNHLDLVEISVDCDQDTLLVKARPAGPVCHTGQRSCFGKAGDPQGFYDLEILWSVISDRLKTAPPGSYTARLTADGPAMPSRKLIEEASELVSAALDHQAGQGNNQRIAEEAADVFYHLLVLLAERDVTPRAVLEELAARRPAR